MTYTYDTQNQNDDPLLAENEWDQFASEILEEFDDSGSSRGCLRMFLILLVLGAAVAAGIILFVLPNLEEEKEDPAPKDFAGQTEVWLEDAREVVAAHEAALTDELLNCPVVLTEDTYQLQAMPVFDPLQEEGPEPTDVIAIMTSIQDELIEARQKILNVCGDNESFDNENWQPSFSPMRQLENARNLITQGETLLTIEE